MVACYISRAETAFHTPSTFPAEDGAKHLLVDATTGFYAYFATFPSLCHLRPAERGEFLLS